MNPRRWMAFAEPHLGAGSLEVGVRLDHFRTNAIRPRGFPRIFSMPGFDPADPTARFVAGRSHTRLSPRLFAVYRLDRRTSLHAGVGAMAQMPDFALALQGINTDLAVTSILQPYGTDLDFKRATLAELGVPHRFPSGTVVEATVWTRSDRGLIRTQPVRLFDPLRNQNVNVVMHRNGRKASTTGLDLRLRQGLGAWGQAWPSCSFAGVDSVQEFVSPAHAFGGVLLLTVPGSWPGPGGLLRDVSLGVVARLTTGVTYLECPAFDVGNASVASDLMR